MKGAAREVRRAILTRLKAHAGLTALVPAAHIHGIVPLVEPVWPFIKLGPPLTLPIRMSCTDGATVSMGVHAFARARFNGSGQMIETAEDHAARIGAEIEKALDAKGETFSGARMRYLLTDINLMVDGADSEAMHYFANVSTRVMA